MELITRYAVHFLLQNNAAGFPMIVMMENHALEILLLQVVQLQVVLLPQVLLPVLLPVPLPVLDANAQADLT